MSAGASTFRLIAHRGASAEAPENTAAAFARAVELEVSEVELDVRRSRDGRLVLFHDPVLRPKVAHDGRAEDHDLADLTTFDIGRWFDSVGVEALYAPGLGWDRPALPRFSGEPLLGFDAYLARFGRFFAHHVELKGADPDLPDLALARLRAHACLDRAVLISFRHEQVQRVRALAPDIPTAWLIRDLGGGHARWTDAIERCRMEGISTICPAAPAVTIDLVRRARRAGLGVRVWRVRTAADLRHAIASGADGATVNWISQARRIVDAAARRIN
ncbi:MAG: glycerophosphodiester phosphodiesterase [Actinobacteria bacterium]|nr:glycerophosphodiester phosphodiesterase [Actinomycetota bacterium]